MPFFGSERILDFDAYLRSNSIPINGLSLTADAPGGVEIDFAVEATVEQIGWANNAATEFDWRKRRLLTSQQIRDHIAGLTSAQQNAILRRMIAAFIRQNKNEALAMIAEQGISLPIDEVDPT